MIRSVLLVFLLVFGASIAQASELDLLQNKFAIAKVELAKTELMLKYKQKHYKRIAELVDKNVLNSKIRDEMEYEYESYKLEVQIKRLQLKRVEIEIKMLLDKEKKR